MPAEVHLGLHEERAVVLAAVLGNFAQVDAPALQAYPPARDARHIEKVVHELRQVTYLALDDLLCAFRVFTLRGGVIEQVHAGLDRPERVAQFMRKNAQKMIPALVEFGQS